jgi:hypothetical protein
MTKLTVNPGVCGLTCVITADTNDDGEVTVQAETNCKAVLKMIEEMEQPLEPYEVCFGKPGEGAVYEAAVNLAHASCPIPSAILKCIEAESSLALPREVKFEFAE